MTRLLAIAAFFCLAVPAALAAPPVGQGPSGGSTPNPSQLCAQQLQTMGAVNFRSVYAPTGNGKNAFGKCVSRQAQLGEATAENAAKKCKAEQALAEADFKASHSGMSFSDFYGKNANKKNAFGKCVSMKAQEASDDRQDATLNAAKKCKAERALPEATFMASHGGMTFSEFYGKNANKKNAFGKCVSKTAKPASTP